MRLPTGRLSPKIERLLTYHSHADRALPFVRSNLSTLHAHYRRSYGAGCYLRNSSRVTRSAASTRSPLRASVSVQDVR